MKWLCIHPFVQGHCWIKSGYNSWITKFNEITRKLPFIIRDPFDIKAHHVKSNLVKDFKNKWTDAINSETQNPKLRTYKNFKKELKFEPYLSLPSFKQRKAIAQFRSGTHWLKIETGRYEGLSRTHRICIKCGVVEDEIHNLLDCNRFTSQRKELLELAGQAISNFVSLNKLEKFNAILSSPDTKLLHSLGKFLVLTNNEYDYKI